MSGRVLKGIEFLCRNHRNCESVSTGEKFQFLSDNSLVSNIKVNSYKLNINEKLHDKLKNIDGELVINERDSGGQYKISLSSTSYQLIVDNIWVIGNSLGDIKPKGSQVDSGGTAVQVQAIINIAARELEVAVTCYHTNSTLLIQLMGSRSTRSKDQLSKFVYDDFVKVMMTLESTNKYAESREMLIDAIEKELGEYARNINFGNDVLPVAGREIVDSSLASINESVGDGVNMSEGQLCAMEPEEVIDLHPLNERNGQVNKLAVVDGKVEIEEVLCQPLSQETDKNTESSMPTVEIEKDNENKKDEDKSGEDVVRREIIGPKVDDSNAVVIVKKKKAADSSRKFAQSFNLLRKSDNSESVRNNLLFNVIVKLKEKGDEMKQERFLSYTHTANERINDLTLKLVSKQSESERLKKKIKDLELQVSNAKKKEGGANHDQEKHSKSHEKEIKKLRNEITDMKEQGGADKRKIKELKEQLAVNENELVGAKHLNRELNGKLLSLNEKVKEISKSENELKQKLCVMEAVAGAVKDNDCEIVVVNEAGAKEDLEKDKDLSSLKNKLDESLKQNSVLKDQLAESKSSLDSIDKFYQDILETKDKMLKEYITITTKDSDEDVKLKRLLVKFRSDNELKLLNDLKASLAGGIDKSGEIDKPGESKVEPVSIHRQESAKINVKTDNDSRVSGRGENNEPSSPRKGLCRDGKLCPSIESCEFRHELVNKLCRFGQQCNKKQKCLFMHVNKPSSFFGHDLSGLNVKPTSGVRDELNNGGGDSYARIQNVSLQWEGYNNNNNYNNNNRTADWWGEGVASADRSQPLRRKLCWKGKSCEVSGCKFWHEVVPKPCRNGIECVKKNSTCLFSHGGESRPSANKSDEMHTANNNTNVEINQNMWLRAKN